jgi:signal transduction histidine kinase
MKNGSLIFLISLWVFSTAAGQSFRLIDDLNQQAEAQVNGNTDSANALATKAIKLSKAEGYNIGLAQGLSILGYSSYIKGDYEKAKLYSEQSIEIGQESGLREETVLAFQALGMICINQGKSAEAIRIFSRLVDLAAEESNQQLAAEACSNLGLAYLNKKYNQRAQKWMALAIQMYKKIEDPQGEVFANLNYARLFLVQDNFDSALLYTQRSAAIARTTDNDRALLHAMMLLGKISQREGKLAAAEHHYSEAYKMSSDANLIWEKANLATWLCDLYYEKKNFEEAIKYGEIAVALGRDAKLIFVLQRVNNLLAKSYLENNELQEAESHLRYLEHIIDSLALEDSVDLMSTIIDLHTLKEEELNLEFISKQLAKAKAGISQRNMLLAGSILTSILLLIILTLIVRSSRVKTRNNVKLLALNAKIGKHKERLEKANDALDATNKEKDLLLGMVAHDIRSPLNKISGLVHILELETDATDNRHEIYSMVQRTIKDAKKLANELLEINKIESGTIRKTEDILHVSEFIRQLIDQHKAIAAEKNIQLQFIQNCDEVEFVSDRKILQRIFENLLSNAIKFSEKNSIVRIKADIAQNQIIMKVIDEGLGIAKEEQHHLFTKFGKTSTRPTNGESSNGLGLYIVDQLIKTVGGNLTFQSELGKGSQFEVALPLST